MDLTEYKTPSGEGISEFVEKRSRFIGYVVPVTDEDEARGLIARKRAEHHDARHNCWCYILRGGAERYSDDGEPQGTAGLPMLEVFRRGGILNACCVVTRYFGGILLGPGGLLRAYSEAAKLALADAGIVTMRLQDCAEIVCPYNLQSRVKTEVINAGGIPEDIIYGQEVTIRALFPAGESERLAVRISDLSAGTLTVTVTGKRYAPST